MDKDNRKYIFVLLIGLILILMAQFVCDLKHDKAVDRIFKKAEIERSKF